MRKGFGVVLGSGLIGIGALMATALAAPQGSSWTLAKEDSLCQVWVRPAPGSDFKMFHGEIRMHAPMSKVEAVLQDVPRYPQWYHRMVEARVLRQISPTTSLRYTVTDMPWPVTDRDAVIFSEKTKLSAHGATGQTEGFRIQFHAQPEAYPKQPDRIRVPKLTGYWEVKPEGNGLKVTFEAAAEPGGEIPSWLANQLVEQMPWQTLHHLKDRVEAGQVPDKLVPPKSVNDILD